jgi:hypothetical protein
MFKWLRRDKPRLQVEGEDFFLLTWDSCRYDTYVAANTPNLDAITHARKAYSMACYTLPSHVAMFNGFLPHCFDPEPFYNRYVHQLWRICHRNVRTPPLVTFPVGTPNIVAGFQGIGYYTVGFAAMDWFRDAKFIQEGFTHFVMTGCGAREQHRRLFKELDARPDQPCFAFINYGETHSPFKYEGMPKQDAPDDRFSLARLLNQKGVKHKEWAFDTHHFNMQKAAAEFLDTMAGELITYIKKRNRPTTVIICGDHGECFGEDGLYGHAFYHEKVMEIPLLIFRLNAPPHKTPDPVPVKGVAREG